MAEIKTISEVVNNGYCVGCGACSVGNSDLVMKMNSLGHFLPYGNLDARETPLPDADLCPMLSPLDEDEIADEVLSVEARREYKKHVGFIHKAWAGHVKSGQFRRHGSSGGMVSWLAAELLGKNYIDALIHVKESPESDFLFEYAASFNVNEITAGAKSRYYPVKLDDVVRLIQSKNDKRYAVIGLPCMIKAMRLMMRKDEQLRHSVKYLIGIVCGHLKTTGFAEALAWQQGITPDKVETVDFRRKLKFRSASAYGFSATSTDGHEIVTPMSSLEGGNWGQGYFKLPACDFCDDVFAETADVVIGDAWISKYKKDAKGNNIIVSRNQEVSNLIELGCENGELQLEVSSGEEAYESQKAGITHRSEGLAYRLGKRTSLGGAVPKKRVEAGDFRISENRAAIYDMRIILQDSSFRVFEIAKSKKQLSFFLNAMRPLGRVYASLYEKEQTFSYLKLLKAKLKNLIRKITRTYNREVFPKDGGR